MWSSKNPGVDPWLPPTSFGYGSQADSSMRETNNGMTNDWPARNKSPSIMSDFSR